MSDLQDSDLDEIRGGITFEEDCPYIPGRKWRNFVVDASLHLDARLHEYLLNIGFRRMAKVMFKPVCRSCAECRPLRVDVDAFQPTKSQRRVRRRNADVAVELLRPEYTEEKRELLDRYLLARHTGPMTAEEESVRRYMYDAPLETLCIDYRVGGKLIGSGLVDILDNVLSSVYFFFDPTESRRSPGVFSMLYEIETARALKKKWFHPGFHIPECTAMNYKNQFRPCDILLPDGRWVRDGDGGTTEATARVFLI